MDIGSEVRRYRAEPLVSPVPGAAAPVEEPAYELSAPAGPVADAAVGEHETTTAAVEVTSSV